jgi:hypothetical protein
MAQKSWMHAKNGSSPLLNEVIDLYRNDDVSPFWQKRGAESGYYTDLNNIIVPTEQEIQKYQLQHIEDLQKVALAHKDASIEKLNQLFTTGDVNSLPSKFKEDEQLNISDSLTEIVTMINSTYGARTGSGENTQIKFEQLQRGLKSLYNALTNLLAQLNGTSGVYQKHLQTILDAMNACELRDLSSGAIQN